MNTTTIYKPIPGHAGYRAGEDGSIWSCWNFKGSGYAGQCKQVMTERWRRLKGDPRKGDGRRRYTLRKDGGGYRRCYAATFVLEAFVGPCPAGLECCHNNGDRTDDSAGNLRWDTSAANKADMDRHGTRPKGEQIGTAKLTVDDVRAIRNVGYPLRQHADRFGISEAMASLIIRRKAWKHVA